MSNPGKTPIQILHEYGTKIEAHQPCFVFSVKIGD
uniref:Uncharacterized protein n=1 Tax=Lates calcarifer TaxID=8187 RepID=A0A4W6C360_LATCA